MRKNLTQSTQFPLAIITLTNATRNVYATIEFVDRNKKVTHRMRIWSDEVIICDASDTLSFVMKEGQMVAAFEQASRYTIIDNRTED